MKGRSKKGGIPEILVHRGIYPWTPQMAKKPENPGVSQLSRLGELLNTLQKCTPPGGPPARGSRRDPPGGAAMAEGYPRVWRGIPVVSPPDPTGIYHTDW